MRRPAREQARLPSTARRSGRSAAPQRLRRRILRFTMPSRREEVGPAVDRIIAAVAPAALEQDKVDSLAVAVAEALSNAVVHGNRMQAARAVRVSVTVVPRASAMVEVSDSGPGFDAAT